MFEAKVIKLDDIIEEEVTLEINGQQFICFAEILPYSLELNQTYPVNLYLTFLEGEPKMVELNTKKFGHQKLEDGYSYLLFGEVDGDQLDIGHDIKIQDEIFKKYTFLNSKFIEIVVDRLGVEFLEG